MTAGRTGGWTGGAAPAPVAAALLAAGAAAAGLLWALADSASRPQGVLVDRATGEVWACAAGGCQVND